MSRIIKIMLVSIAMILIFKNVIVPMRIKTEELKESSEVIQSENFTSIEQNAFNNLFTVYEGNQKGAYVKALVQVVSSHNQTGNRNVSIEFKGTIYSNSNISAVSNLIATTNTYDVKIKYDSDNYVEMIVID